MLYFLRVKVGGELKFSGFVSLDESLDLSGDLSESILFSLPDLTYGAFVMGDRVLVTGVMSMGKDNHFTMEIEGAKCNAEFSLHAPEDVDYTNLYILVEKRSNAFDLYLDAEWDMSPMVNSPIGGISTATDCLVFLGSDLDGLKVKYPKASPMSYLSI